MFRLNHTWALIGSRCIQRLVEQALVFSASSNPVMHLCQDFASSIQCKIFDVCWNEVLNTKAPWQW